MMAMAVGAAVLATAMMMSRMPPDLQLDTNESHELMETKSRGIVYTVEKGLNTHDAKNAFAPRNPPNMKARSIHEVQESYAQNNTNFMNQQAEYNMRLRNGRAPVQNANFQPLFVKVLGPEGRLGIPGDENLPYEVYHLHDSYHPNRMVPYVTNNGWASESSVIGLNFKANTENLMDMRMPYAAGGPMVRMTTRPSSDMLPETSPLYAGTEGGMLQPKRISFS